MVLIVNSCR